MCFAYYIILKRDNTEKARMEFIVITLRHIDGAYKIPTVVPILLVEYTFCQLFYKQIILDAWDRIERFLGEAKVMIYSG